MPRYENNYARFYHRHYAIKRYYAIKDLREKGFNYDFYPKNNLDQYIEHGDYNENPYPAGEGYVSSPVRAIASRIYEYAKENGKTIAYRAALLLAANLAAGLGLAGLASLGHAGAY